MSVEEILEEMENLLFVSSRLWFTNKRMIDEDEMCRLIDELREVLPGELMEANRVITERQQILEQAQKEAQNIVDRAKDYISKLTGENNITRQAQEQANEILEQAKKSSRDLQNDSIVYADEVFGYLEDNLAKALEVVKQGHRQLHQDNKDSA